MAMKEKTPIYAFLQTLAFPVTAFIMILMLMYPKLKKYIYEAKK